MRRLLSCVIVAAAFVAGAAPAAAQEIDTILVNGKILTVDAQFSTRSALAVREGRIAALGSDADIRKLAGPKTRMIDLQGRTVIPGLIDSHLHAIRAALSFSTEVNWIGAPSLADALGRIREAARTTKPGAWLIVAGGWNVDSVQGKPAADAGGARRRRAGQSGLRAARVRLGDADAARRSRR